MNRRAREKSPYLLQHAHNPVDWYPWGDEAFERARREDKPVFLSIGYSTCHWCHVMERESFADDEAETGRALERLAPFTKDMDVGGGPAAAYVCSGGTCLRPVSSAAELLDSLR